MIIRFMRDGKVYELTEYDVDGLMIYLSEIEKDRISQSKEGECLNVIESVKNKRKTSQIVELLTKEKNPVKFSRSV